jgi:hypothetical protein
MSATKIGVIARREVRTEEEMKGVIEQNEMTMREGEEDERDLNLLPSFFLNS